MTRAAPLYRAQNPPAVARSLAGWRRLPHCCCRRACDALCIACRCRKLPHCCCRRARRCRRQAALRSCPPTPDMTSASTPMGPPRPTIASMSPRSPGSPARRPSPGRGPERPDPLTFSRRRRICPAARLPARHIWPSIHTPAHPHNHTPTHPITHTHTPIHPPRAVWRACGGRERTEHALKPPHDACEH